MGRMVRVRVERRPGRARRTGVQGEHGRDSPRARRARPAAAAARPPPPPGRARLWRCSCWWSSGSGPRAHYTSRSSYCLSCHEMRPYYTSWQASPHGAEAQCVDCHIPRGAASYIGTKLFSVRELYVHLTRQVKAPVMVTRAIPDANCTGCHPTPKSSTFATSSVRPQRAPSVRASTATRAWCTNRSTAPTRPT